MKIKILAIIVVIVFMFACKPESYYKDTLVLNLTKWSFPDTVKVATSFELNLSTITKSSCTKTPGFVVEYVNTDTYHIYATAIYESYNNDCHEKIVETDKIITGQIDQVGRYYFLFLKDNIWNRDSIQVIP